MSSAVFPTISTLPGQGWSITRTPVFSTRKPIAISGKETAIADWSFPRYSYKLIYNVLRQGKGIYIPTDAWAEFATLIGFFNERLGGEDTFLYTDNLDNAVVGQSIGLGDGSTKTFQLIRTFGGFVDPIFAPNLNLTYNVYVNGVKKTAGTDYVIVPWGAGTGVIIGGTCSTSSSSSPDVLTSVVLPSSQNPQPNAVVEGSGIPFGSTISQVGPTTLTIDNNATATASDVPILIAGSGMIVFASAPSNTLPITADFSYYWPCRFDKDKFDFEQFDTYRVKVREMTFMTVKG